jgi:3-polyprenyl-4-hydroxybenzoate decarboxylase
MTELIVAILGAAGAIVALRAFDKFNINKGQKKLEDKVKENDKKQAGLEGEQRQEDKETQRKVDEITKEQNDKPTGSDLSDWFNRRK